MITPKGNVLNYTADTYSLPTGTSSMILLITPTINNF